MIQDKRILITGATGYIGSQLMEDLVADNNLYCTFRIHENRVSGEKIDGSSMQKVR
jgi:nucleoside-diphosphate-sugar epimerase